MGMGQNRNSCHILRESSSIKTSYLGIHQGYPGFWPTTISFWGGTSINPRYILMVKGAFFGFDPRANGGGLLLLPSFAPIRICQKMGKIPQRVNMLMGHPTGFTWKIPKVNVYILMWKTHGVSLGKPIYKWWMFHIEVLPHGAPWVTGHDDSMIFFCE